MSVESLKQYHVAIATPTYQGVSIAYVSSLLKTCRTFWESGLSISHMIGRGASVERQRNQLVAQFLRDESFTHLLWIDADEGWEPMAVLRLLAMGHEFVGAPVAKKTDDVHAWNVNLPEIERHEVSRGAIEVADIGTGFTLLARSVFERMTAAYPEMRINGEEKDWGAHLWNFYARMHDEKGHDVSEDYAFCRRWRSIGGRIWADPEAAIRHVGEKEWCRPFAEVLAP